jgi:hypothetical protein
MTAAPTWSILVPTLGERRALFERLLDGLMPQVARQDGRVQVVAWHNNGRPSLPEIRQRMVLAAETEYVSFVDDDDLVAPDYVAEVAGALDAAIVPCTCRALTEGGGHSHGCRYWRPDYVGFQLQCYSNGHPTGIAHHSLAFTRWRNMPGRYERDISHINPMRTSIARRADFRTTRAGGAEDRAWADQLRRMRALRTEVVIPRILYHYLHVTPDKSTGSRWKNPRLIRAGSRSNVVHPYFTWSNDA